AEIRVSLRDGNQGPHQGGNLPGAGSANAAWYRRRIRSLSAGDREDRQAQARRSARKQLKTASEYLVKVALHSAVTVSVREKFLRYFFETESEAYHEKSLQQDHHPSRGRDRRRRGTRRRTRAGSGMERYGDSVQSRHEVPRAGQPVQPGRWQDRGGQQQRCHQVLPD